MKLSAISYQLSAKARAARGMAILAMNAHGQDARGTAGRPQV